MKRDASGAGPCLSAVFVDYDNIYLSLRRKNEDAARRFAKDASIWIRAIEQGTLITPTNGPVLEGNRRIVMNRCYGNPVPRRSSGDNATDMSSFPFVRHHFLRAGFEIVDCPPLTAQLKNSSDIRMVMDVRDFLHHDTYFDEFVILSGDADFTPVLHRLRAHARRTVIYANDYTAAPYTAISDGEIRESDFIALLLEGRTGAAAPAPQAEAAPAATAATPAAVASAITARPAAAAPARPAAEVITLSHDTTREEILEAVVESVRAATGPVPIETLADRAVRALGAEKTSGTNWAGAGGFRTFLIQNLPDDIRLTDQAPYYAYDVGRHGSPDGEAGPRPASRAAESRAVVAAPAARSVVATPIPQAGIESMAVPAAAAAPAYAPTQRAARPATRATQEQPAVAAEPQVPSASLIQQAIARIYDACQAPPLGPAEYRTLFELMAQELTENKLSGAQTLSNVLQRANEHKLRVTRDDVRFVFDVVSEADPWFEQGVSAALFAGRFRNFVIARCRTQGLSLSADDIDLIDRLFAGGPLVPSLQKPAAASAAQQPAQQDRWWSGSEPAAPARQAPATGQRAATDPALPDGGFGTEELPRIVRSRMRG